MNSSMGKGSRDSRTLGILCTIGESTVKSSASATKGEEKGTGGAAEPECLGRFVGGGASKSITNGPLLACVGTEIDGSRAVFFFCCFF